jgi:hypothetical protein
MTSGDGMVTMRFEDRRETFLLVRGSADPDWQLEFSVLEGVAARISWKRGMHLLEGSEVKVHVSIAGHPAEELLWRGGRLHEIKSADEWTHALIRRGADHPPSFVKFCQVIQTMSLGAVALPGWQHYNPTRSTSPRIPTVRPEDLAGWAGCVGNFSAAGAGIGALAGGVAGAPGGPAGIAAGATAGGSVGAAFGAAVGLGYCTVSELRTEKKK